MTLEISVLFIQACAALFVGFAKAGVPVLGGFVSVALVLLLPAKDAVGLTLMYFIVGDIIVSVRYWKAANWQLILRMLPLVVLGVMLGAWTLSRLSNQNLSLLIAILIIVLVLMEPLRDFLGKLLERYHRITRSVVGVIAGFTSTVGNAGGPVMSIYLLLLKVDKFQFVSSSAVFFLILNFIKLPFFGVVGLFNPEYFTGFLLTLPLVYIGTLLGSRFLHWVPQQRFNQIVLILTALSGVMLLIKSL